jgi:anti-sigma regulatory factor (Ser/Thr protein kinase)
VLRRELDNLARRLNFPTERQQDFETAVHEAAMNAVKYGGGGTARIHGDTGSGTLQVWVEDQGPGIAEELIHRAVERGYTTEGFGHGMFFMQSCADRLYLLTGPKGTTVVLEQERTPPTPSWLTSVGG